MSDWEEAQKRRVQANGHRGACAFQNGAQCDCDEPVRLRKTVKVFVALLIIIPTAIAGLAYSAVVAPELTGMVLFGAVMTAIFLVVFTCTIAGLWEWAQSIVGAGYDPNAKRPRSASQQQPSNE